LIYKDDILLRDSTLITEAEGVGDEPDGIQTISESMVEPFENSKVIKKFRWIAN
jgi:hypothetical protein